MVGTKNRRDPNPAEQICKCGIKVKGISEKHLLANIELHKVSKLHKQLLQNQKEVERLKKIKK